MHNFKDDIPLNLKFSTNVKQQPLKFYNNKNDSEKAQLTNKNKLVYSLMKFIH